MVVSFIHPNTCGFAKAAIWRFTKDAVVNIKRVDTETPYQHRVRTVQAIHELFCQMFGREEVENYPDNPRAGGAKRRARVLIPPGYLHPGKRKH
jgi:hypothetical protein